MDFRFGGRSGTVMFACRLGFVGDVLKRERDCVRGDYDGNAAACKVYIHGRLWHERTGVCLREACCLSARICCACFLFFSFPGHVLFVPVRRVLALERRVFASQQTESNGSEGGREGRSMAFVRQREGRGLFASRIPF